MKRVLTALAAMLAVLLPGAPAWAHNKLTSSDPAANATLGTAPGSITVVFAEWLNPDFTTIAVSDTARQRVASSAAVVDGQSGTVTLSRPLGNGAYTVAYRVVSADGHAVQGSYVFTVSDPSFPPAAAAPPAAQAATPAGSGGMSITVMVSLAGIGAVLAVVAAVSYLSGRRRASPSPR